MDITAVVDRFEGDQAVLLVGAEEMAAVWPRASLPAGVREGHVLTVRIAGDNDATVRTQAAAAALLERLQRRGKKGK